METGKTPSEIAKLGTLEQHFLLASAEIYLEKRNS